MSCVIIGLVLCGVEMGRDKLPGGPIGSSRALQGDTSPARSEGDSAQNS